MDSTDLSGASPGKGYALSGKIMLSAIVILFFVVILMVCLHLYARWYLLRARRRHSRRVRHRRTHLVFYVDSDNPNPAHVTVPARGLDSAVLKSLPVFVFDPKTHPESIECAVCLSELEENETGRVLPKCNHSFHIECIDMWFHSHSTCPLCRSPVEPVPEKPTRDADSGSSTGSEIVEVETDLCETCQHEMGGASTSSFAGRRKPVELVGITIEVPGRTGNFGDELGTESPASQSFRSPMSRMLSFTRMSRMLSPMSRDRRASSSATSCETDIERGREGSNRQTQGGVGGIEN